MKHFLTLTLITALTLAFAAPAALADPVASATVYGSASNDGDNSAGLPRSGEDGILVVVDPDGDVLAITPPTGVGTGLAVLAYAGFATGDQQGHGTVGGQLTVLDFTCSAQNGGEGELTPPHEPMVGCALP